MKVLTFVEIDVDRCALEYGRGACTAHAWQKTDGAGYFNQFENTTDSWSVDKVTLTAQAGGMRYVATDWDPKIFKTGLSVNGADNQYVFIDFTCVQPGSGWDGRLFYGSSGGHGFNAGFYKSFGITNPAAGQRVRLLLDMADLTVGGDDWITNTITAIRFDLPAAGPGEYIIHEISVGALKEPTGARHCFNSLGTCQDRANFDNEPITYRFAVNTDYLPLDEIPCIPNVDDYSYSPGKISLGVDLGIRASLTITFSDHPHSDAGPAFDKYPEVRDYDPYKRGTFWGKFRARNPYLAGRPLRLIRGVLGQSLEEMETIHLVIDSFSGPSLNNKFTLVAKDVLALASGDKAQAPVLSRGRLVADIASDATSASLTPPGVGNEDYPTSGHVCIGGNEVCAFTRSGDTLTLTRAQHGTVASAHSANDRVQLCLSYTSQNAAVILHDLLVNYAGVDASYVDLPAWETEVDTFLQQQYTTIITEPTSVADLCVEIIETAALALWWDAVAKKLRLQVLREVLPQSTLFDQDTILEGSFDIKEQPNLRISQVWVYFARRDPTRPLTDEDNYRATDLSLDLETEANYEVSAIKKIYSRWIGLGGLAVAQAVSALILSQYKNPPRQVSLALLRDGNTDMVPGIGYRVSAWPVQDDTGAQAIVNCQVVARDPRPDTLRITAEEMNFSRSDILSTRYIYLSSNEANINLRTIHDTYYPAPHAGDVGNVTVHAIVDTGATIYSTGVSTPALTVGDWPEGLEVIVEIRGSVRGRCGDGGAGGRGGNTSGTNAGNGQNGSAGQNGGVALYTRHEITLRYSDGQIFGGAGGGGGGAGGGAAVGTPPGGQVHRRCGSGGGGGGCFNALGGGAGGARGNGGTGSGANAGNNGTAGGIPNGGAGGARKGINNLPYYQIFGGGGGTGGNAGSDWGQPGQAALDDAIGGLSAVAGGSGDVGDAGNPGAGGAAGAAIDGWSYVTVEGAAGDLRGPTIN